ncbi:MAG: phytanoyl-CoA dioxygenase family protein [Candidatus Didemnitutus sp.]|nr:phytanoyl-CoA dioxygenase family protein [Candidatus Didemnitutus sp.]
MPTSTAAIRVVLESKIEPHHPQLYSAQDTTDYVEGFAGITPRDLATYDERGFLVVRGGLTPAEVEAAKKELERMTLADDPVCTEIYYEGSIRDHLSQQLADSRKSAAEGHSASLALGAETNRLPDIDRQVRARLVRKFMGFVPDHPPLAAAALKPELLALVERLAREPARLFQDMAMIKPAGGREKPWHQDHAYFNFPVGTRIVGVWIALGSVNPENGCMFVLAGGHKLGPRIHFKRRDWQICDTEIMACRQMALPMEAGDIMLFDAKLPHGTPTNRTNENRWALQFHYVPHSAQGVADELRLAVFGSEGKNVTC